LPYHGLEEILEMLGCFNARELELDDDGVHVADGMMKPLCRHARVTSCIGEPVERCEPRAKV
jgi:hypothetical protein